MITPSVAKVIRATGAPDFVKSASISEDGNYDFRTKESTYVSFVKALIKQASGSEMEDVIHHARFWKIENECARVKSKYAELMTVPELTDSDYAVCVDINDAKGARTVRKFAAYDPASTTTAAIAFYDSRTSFPYDIRHDAAQHLLHKAAQHHVVLPEYVQRYLEKAAALGAFDEDGLDNLLIEREQSLQADNSEAFAKVAQVIESAYSDPSLRSNPDFVKVACAAVDTYDTLAGFTGTLPEEAIGDALIASELTKVAHEQRYTVSLVNGHELDVRQLRKEALAAVSPALSTMSTDELIDVLPTLPRTDADVLSKILS